MREIPEATLDPGPVWAVQMNLWRAISACRAWPQADFHDEAGLGLSLTSVPFVPLRLVGGTNPTPDQLETAKGSIPAEARSHRVPVQWLFGPVGRSPDLGARLATCGFFWHAILAGIAGGLARGQADSRNSAGLSLRLVACLLTSKPPSHEVRD